MGMQVAHQGSLFDGVYSFLKSEKGQKGSSEALGRKWHVVVESIKSSFGGITALFFRILSFFKPSLGLQLETIWVRGENAWLRMKSGWEKEGSKGEEPLQEKVATLEKCNRDLAKERSAFFKKVKGLKKEVAFLKQTKTELLAQIEELTDEVQEESRWLQIEDQGKEEEVVLLKKELASSRASRESLVQKNQRLEARIKKLLQQTALSQKQRRKVPIIAAPLVKDALSKNWLEVQRKIADALEKMALIKEPPHPAFDMGVQTIVPELQRQKKEALQEALLARDNMSLDHPARPHLDALIFIYQTEGDSLTRIANAIARHSEFTGLISKLTKV